MCPLHVKSLIVYAHIDRPLKPLHILSVAIDLPPFPVICPGTIRSMDRPAVLHWLCADETCSAQCLRRRTATAQLRFLLSTLLLDMKHDATDRFMRDTICGCYGAERFLLLHHMLHDSRPQFSGNTIVRVFWPWSSVLRIGGWLSSSASSPSQQALHL